MHKNRLVFDTTVCIDLYNGQLLEKVGRLPFELLVPDVILAELIVPQGELLTGAGFSELPLGEEAVEQVVALRSRYLQPSANDLFALVLAKLNSCTLITGDDALRKAAKREAVVVHGLLWILDQLISHNIVTPLEAADALARILAEGSWLPKKECDARLRRWRG